MSKNNVLELENFHTIYLSSHPLDVYRDNGLEVLHYPLENFSVPDRIELFDETIRFIQEKLIRHCVLIHCMASCGRTGMMAAKVLVRLGWSAANAIYAVRHSRPGSMDVLRQIFFQRAGSDT